MLRRAVFALLVFASCVGPTEIVVDITTNACASLKHTDVYVNGQQVTQAPTPVCPSDGLATIDIGTITLLPTHGIDSHVDITLVGDVGGSCGSPDTTDLQCIVARRSLSFTPHHRLDLPIFLDSACAGLACPPDQTCVVDSTGAHCSDSTCGSSNGDPTCFDGGGVIDAHIDDVITIDVAPPPACPSILPPIGGNASFTWTFPKVTTDGVHEDADQVITPFTTSFIIADPPTFCGEYIRSKQVQALVTSSSNLMAKFTATSFTLGFAFKTPVLATQLVSLATASSFGGFAISLNGGAIVLTFNGPASQQVYVGKTPVSDGLWHRFGIVVKTTAGGTTVDTYVDGAFDKTAIASTYSAGTPASFTLGTADFDSILYYAQ